MAQLNCEACEDLREEVPSLITDGLTSSMCTSLQNDTGLKSSSGHNDCTDLGTMLDCLIGNMETEIDGYDECEWKPFTKRFIDNLYTSLKAAGCAICGIWTNIHNLWATIQSLCLKKSGNKIVLYSNLGDHCSVTDADTTYDLTKSGNKIKLVGSDGTTDEVTDSDTTYGLSRNDHTVTLVAGGTNMSVTIPDDNTTYSMTISGHTITLTPSSGSAQTVTVPDNDTWQPNLSTQNGYVTKGEDDPLKVWCTNSDGIPNWRNSPTLGGSLTLYNHDGPIGETKYWEASSTRSLTTDTELKIDTGIDLSAGTWICCATIGYDINENGNRALGLSFGSAAHRKGVYVRASDHYNGGTGYGSETILAKTYIHVVNSGDTERVYLNAYQNSGSTIDILSNPETYVYCIRIR